jgi:hypothetical protein
LRLSDEGRKAQLALLVILRQADAAGERAGRPGMPLAIVFGVSVSTMRGDWRSGASGGGFAGHAGWQIALPTRKK